MLLDLLAISPPFRRRPYLAASEVGGTTTITATSSLRAPVWFYWWVDGVYFGRTSEGILTLRPEEGERLFVQVCDTRDADYDPSGFLVLAAPARRIVEWIRSLDSNAASYLIEVQIGGGSWSTAAVVTADATTWLYTWRTDPLIDLSQYAWRVSAVDASGNAGTPKMITPEIVVRTPDAPEWSFSFNSGTRQVTFSTV